MTRGGGGGKRSSPGDGGQIERTKDLCKMRQGYVVGWRGGGGGMRFEESCWMEIWRGSKRAGCYEWAQEELERGAFGTAIATTVLAQALLFTLCPRGFSHGGKI